MALISSGILWGIVALGIGIAFLFISGTRLLAYRIAGRSVVHSAETQDPFTVPAFSAHALRHFVWTLAAIAILAVGTAVILLRFVYGIGAVSNLSNEFPWGLLKGLGVMSGVALAAGAFVIAGTAHILRIERFEPLVRPAILTGLLGYLLAIAGLVVDLGRPYNIWRPLVHWQYHSPLWEVGCCVAIYTTVLIIEFLPVLLERVNEYRGITRRLPTESVYRSLTKVSIGFVVLGVVLSTLHQSSLGSLWVLVPGKLHPLWYSLFLPAFFWLSAVAAGLAMTIVVSTISSRALERGLELHLLADLAKAASVVLFIYLLAKALDLISRDAWPYLFEPTVQAAAYWVEIGLGVAVPALLFAIAPLRKRQAVLFSGSLMVVLFGVVLNRLNVSMIGLWSHTGMIYVPSWMEVTVSLALVCLGVVAFGAAAKYLPVFEHERHPHS